MGSIGEWPEPVVCVKSLSETGNSVIPDQYIKPLSDRPLVGLVTTDMNIPVIDLEGLTGTSREATMKEIMEACCDWGFLQVVNHGVKVELVDMAREKWREFFHEPIEVKEKYANSPKSYEGFGSRLGVEKGAILDWSDYYYLDYHPFCRTKWPAHPPSLSDVMEEYTQDILRLGKVLLEVLSINLGLKQDSLQNAFGENDIGVCLRANFYPKCPQPDLTLGLSSHSDPGGLTFLLPDKQVPGLQIRKNGQWITVKLTPNSIIVNIGDQLQVLSNAIYKSVEHRVIVNPDEERVSLAYFYNPKSDLLIQPLSDLVSTSKHPSLYQPMTFQQYRSFIRTKGPQGKFQVDSLKSPTI